MRIAYLYCPEEVIREVEGLTVREKTVCTADRYIVERLRSNNHEVELAEYSDNFVEQIKKLGVDYIFNAADAIDGTEFHGNMLRQIEETGLPFSGCDKNITLLFTDKPNAKKFFTGCNVKTADYQVIDNENFILDASLSFPMIIKPVETDASEGIDEDSVVHDDESLRRKLSEALPKYKRVFVEKYLDGREFCVPVIFNEGKVDVFPILEIDFTEHFENKPKILSFKAKWNKNTNAFKNTYSIVKQLEPEIESKIKDVAMKVFSNVKSKGYATMDVRFNNEDVYVLEVNPNPYLAIECDFIKSAKQAGMTSNELIENIVKLSAAETVKDISLKEN